jgi:hypothetical protein
VERREREREREKGEGMSKKTRALRKLRGGGVWDKRIFLFVG